MFPPNDPKPLPFPELTELRRKVKLYEKTLTEIRDAHPTVVTVMDDGTWRDACREFQRWARLALIGEDPNDRR